MRITHKTIIVRFFESNQYINRIPNRLWMNRIDGSYDKNHPISLQITAAWSSKRFPSLTLFQRDGEVPRDSATRRGRETRWIACDAGIQVRKFNIQSAMTGERRQNCDGMDPVRLLLTIYKVVILLNFAREEGMVPCRQLYPKSK